MSSQEKNMTCKYNRTFVRNFATNYIKLWVRSDILTKSYPILFTKIKEYINFLNILKEKNTATWTKRSWQMRFHIHVLAERAKISDKCSYSRWRGRAWKRREELSPIQVWVGEEHEQHIKDQPTDDDDKATFINIFGSFCWCK